MKKIFLIPLALLLSLFIYSQKTYTDSLQAYMNDYVKDHEVVKENDKKYLQFYPIDETYRVKAKFEKATNSEWFLMETSGHEKKMYRVYGTVSFTIHDTTARLNIYQSQSLLEDPKYKDYLLLLFTDKTSGNGSYDGGRYLDFTLKDIKKNEIVIDFNKAYNPYCAYEKDKYNCPLPPKENDLALAITAGEKNYEKGH
jgi:hypothetical protein